MRLISQLHNIHHSLRSFSELVQFLAIKENYQDKHIEIDMSHVNWMAADMCAVLGAALHHLTERSNTFELINMKPEIEVALSKNGFLSYYGGSSMLDIHGSTIAYKRFDIDDERSFSKYIDKYLINHPELPSMSPKLHKKFSESIFEMFNNAVQHSKSEMGVFSCGQLFPHKHRLNFTIVDLGIGIRQNVKDKLNLNLTAENAIDWATSDNNTTKRAQPSPGGLGLKLLREFIDINGGDIQIVSDAGYWQRREKHTNIHRLRSRFPGTIIALEFNTADSHSYILEGEDANDDIF